MYQCYGKGIWDRARRPGRIRKGAALGGKTLSNTVRTDFLCGEWVSWGNILTFPYIAWSLNNQKLSPKSNRFYQWKKSVFPPQSSFQGKGDKSITDSLQSTEFAFPVSYEVLKIILMNWLYFVLLKYIVTTKLTVLLSHELFGLGGTCYQ